MKTIKAGKYILRVPEELIDRATDPRGGYKHCQTRLADLCTDVVALSKGESDVLLLPSERNSIGYYLYDLQFIPCEVISEGSGKSEEEPINPQEWVDWFNNTKSPPRTKPNPDHKPTT